MDYEINNMMDIIDSRDVIVRIEDLEDEHNALLETLGDAQDALDYHNKSEDCSADSLEGCHICEGLELNCEAAYVELTSWEKEFEDELASLKDLQSQAEGCSDWEHGEALIRDSYFQEYAQELAEDIGLIPSELEWPCRCIDWEQAAQELKHGYTSVEFNGVTYWIRS